MKFLSWLAYAGLLTPTLTDKSITLTLMHTNIPSIRDQLSPGITSHLIPLFHLLFLFNYSLFHSFL